MRNIALFSAQYPPHVGGIERFTKCLAEQLSANGNKVYVVTSNLYSNKPIEIHDNITLVYMPCYPLMEGRLPITKCNKEHTRLKKFLIKQKLDLIIANARFYTHTCFAVKLAYENNIKSVVIEHGSSYIGFNNPIIDPLVHIYEHAVTRYLKKYCKDFYGVSKNASEWSSTFGIHSKGQIPNAINVEEIQKILKETKEIPFTQSTTKPSIVYAGRVIERKGILELSKAVSELSSKYKNIKLAIAGDGELMPKIKQQNHPSTIILGKLGHNQTLKLIEKADIFVLASETEGFPTGVLEAIACKTFVIATHVGGLDEIIQDDSYGMLIKDNNPETITSAIQSALENKEKMIKATIKSFQFVKHNYSWKHTAQLIEDIADKIISNLALRV